MGKVASTGSFYINTLSSSSGTPGTGGSATFNGSANQFTLSNPPTSAEQLLCSINGVVQKPNSGSSVPSEGFAISGSSILFSSAPASSSDWFIITIGASVSIGTPSSNTVSTSTIQNLAVTNDKIANDTIAEGKLDIHNAPSGTDKFLKYTSNGMEWVVPTDTNTTYTAGTGLTLSSTEFSVTDDSIAEVKLDISNTPSDGQYLQYKDSSDKLTWATVSSTPEGTAILSTGESGGTKFLREDGDNSCSWQVPPAATTTSGTNNFTVADGDLIIGTHGHGIDFSAANHSGVSGASMSSELLDDYEEGTWTPTVATGVTSYNSQVGYYTKIGRLVTANGYINISTDSTSSTAEARIYGLPFTSTAGAAMHSPAIGFWYGLPENVPYGYIADTVSFLTLLGENATGERDHVTHNDVFFNRASARVAFTVSYITAS